MQGLSYLQSTCTGPHASGDDCARHGVWRCRGISLARRLNSKPQKVWHTSCCFTSIGLLAHTGVP